MTFLMDFIPSIHFDGRSYLRFQSSGQVKNICRTDYKDEITSEWFVSKTSTPFLPFQFNVPNYPFTGSVYRFGRTRERVFYSYYRGCYGLCLIHTTFTIEGNTLRR